VTIFRQWRQVMDGTKTATCRLKPYKVGSVQSVIPTYLAPAIWWKPETGEIVEHPYDKANELWGARPGFVHEIKHVNSLLTTFGYQRARVRYTFVTQICVQDLTEEDCVAEGVVPVVNPTLGIIGFECPLFPNLLWKEAVDGYRHLWNSINATPKRLRWESDPLVYFHRFELVKP
jgi:hypothetical protein